MSDLGNAVLDVNVLVATSRIYREEAVTEDEVNCTKEQYSTCCKKEDRNGQTETLRKGSLRLIDALCVADNLDNLVDVILSDNQALNDVHALLRLAQVEAAATYDNLVTVLYEVVNLVAEVEQHWTAIYQGDVVHRE